MASIEQTQIFTITATGAGLTGVNYFQLGYGSPPAGSAFIVKDLFISGTTGIDVDYSFLITSASSNAGANSQIVYVDTTGATANEPIFVSDQFILTQAYLGVNVNAISASTITITISYLVIRNPNVLSNNFIITTGTVPANTTTTILIPPSANACIPKSLFVSNINDAINDYIVQCFIYNAANVKISTITLPVTLTHNQTEVIPIPVFLSTLYPTAGCKLSMFVASASGVANVNIYFSYVVNNQA
jgi:hypothetical protein